MKTYSRSKIKSNKLRISPSSLKQSNRCEYSAALKFLPDPNREDGGTYKAFFSDQGNSSRYQGIYFEAAITGKSIEHEDTGFQMWYNKDTEVMNRVDKAAEEAKKWFRFDEPHESGVWLEYEFSDFIIHGEADFIGTVENHDPFNHEVFRSITDIKLTGDIDQVWEVGGNPTIEMYMQTPIYSFLWALNHGEPEFFHKAQIAYMQGKRKEALKNCELFEKNSEILPAAYLIYEQKPIPKFTKPNITMRKINCKGVDFLTMYYVIRAKKQIWDELRIGGNKYSKSLELKFVHPNKHKCLGHGRLLENKGRCPLMAYCPYGKKLLTSCDTIQLSDLLREYSTIL